MPSAFVRPVAGVVPVAEVVAGIALLVGLGIRLTGVAVAAMLAVFTTAVAVALLQRREVSCGCFGDIAPRRITWLTVTRNVALLVLALLLAWEAPTALALDGVYLAGRPATSTSHALALLVVSTSGLVLLALVRATLRLGRLAATNWKGGLA